MFDDPVDGFTAGRIRLFQQVVFDACGAYSTIVKGVPACLKVFFELDIELDEIKDDLRTYFDSAEFSATSEELGILYVQFSGKIFKKNEVESACRSTMIWRFSAPSMKN